MSIDFDSGALQTQHDDEEYDKEDYAREQELQQLLIDLPHDMLDDSLSSSPEPDYSDCSGHEISQQIQQWEPGAGWDDGEGMPNHQKQYKNGYSPNQYCMEYGVTQGEQRRNQTGGDKMTNGWDTLHTNEDESMFDGKYSYNKEHATEESNGGAFHNGDHYDAPDHCSNSELYHLPEDFQPYTNGHQQTESFPEAKRDHFQRFISSEGTSNQPAEPFQVKYNPYQLNVTRKDLVNQDPARGDGNCKDLQKEFLDTGESSASNIQFVQLQVLYKARGRQLEELNEKLQESERQIRYLNHQLAIFKDQKDGMAISLQESQTLLQNSREMEVQLKGKLTALETTIDGLTTNEEQLRKELKVAKAAMESMQQQLLDMRRSDSLQRAREQHETFVSMLKKKNEEQVLALQQKLDDVNSALIEQKELCNHLEAQVKQAERKQEEGKLEKNEMINRLSRSLEESQKQCANLLQTGSIQEATQLRLQLQQVQSAKIISDDMNKALQEELSELKEQITMYESASTLGVFLNGGEQEDLSDSYVDLGIKKVNWQKSRFRRAIQSNGIRKDLSTDEIIMELKTELERCLNSNKTKRHQIVQLQADLKGYESKTKELKKQLEKAERTARDSEIKAESLEKQLDPSFPYRHTSSEESKEELKKLQSEKQLLQEEIEKHLLCIKELRVNEEKLKASNQELCNEMRAMIQDFDRDKKEAIERCERTYQQHHEDIKDHLKMELAERFASEKEQLCRDYEETICQLQSRISELSQEMTSVQECYIAVCKEKDSLEDTVRENLKAEIQANEEKFKDTLIKETEKSLQKLKAELEEKHQSTLLEAKDQWQRERVADLDKQIETKVALAKETWTKEQLQITEKTIQDVEKEWKHKLDKAVHDAKMDALQNLQDHAIQTDQTFVTKAALDAECIEELKVKLQNALQEREQAVREAQMEMQMQYHEDIAKQVELALMKARARWLQELTSLSEYKANLKLEQEKWEKMNELVVTKRISNALAAAEETWKTRTGKVELHIRKTQLEEKIASLTRELELKDEEFQAQLKSELAKARAQWNKEKQDEILKIQEHNEKDYRIFLDEHRAKIAEVLSTTKGDFEKQKNELIAQKDTEIKERLDQCLKQWASEESQRMRDHENDILSELELYLGEIHDELVDKRIGKDRLSSVTSDLDVKFLEKLRTCLQRSIKGIIYKVLTNAKQEWKKKHQETRASPELKVAENEGERFSVTNKENVHKMTKMHLEKLHGDTNVKCKDDNCTYPCCEHWVQQLEKSKKECHELRNKLDKACRHLQQAVKDQKLKAEQFKGSYKKPLSDIFAETLRKQNKELHKKLEEMKASKSPQRFQPEEGIENGCALCRGNALEEMRAQYIKAVDKIKNDMVRYIHESKGRAAEMLKSEVLRERQETARKMRKYYLTCLQQLLRDDGKNEGAEKKILNAASKLATMAKVLETPISQKWQSKNLRSALQLSTNFLPETDDQRDPLKTVQTCDGNRPNDPSIDQKTIEEFIRRHIREKSEENKVPHTEGSSAIKDRSSASVQLRKDCSDQRNTCDLQSASFQFITRVPSEKVQVVSCKNLNSESVSVTPQREDEPSFLNGIKGYHCREYPKTKSNRKRFDLQETPVRDENAHNDGSCGSLKGLFPSQPSQCSLSSLKKQLQVSTENSSAEGLFHIEEGTDAFGSDCKDQNYSTHFTKRKDVNPGTLHSIKNMGLPTQNAESSLNSKLNSHVAHGIKQPTRKLLDFTSTQQDSGFDSPFTN
ncbi:centrosomal protein of 152 kDa [Rhinophrynus dorsalis]